jgi:hypothetical protein
MPRRLPTVLGTTVLLVTTWAGLAAADDGTTVPGDTSPDTTFVYDLENEPSQCIGFLPRPGCGKAPQQAGDRGGALQWAVFGVLMAGVGTVGAVLVRNVVRRDRAMNASLSGDDPGDDRA